MSIHGSRSELDGEMLAAIERERVRLWRFIRSRIPDRSDAEDILQEVFSEFVAAYHLMQPIQNAGACMFRVARNRVTDLFRKKRPVAPGEAVTEGQAGGCGKWEELLPSPDAGPDAAFARGILIDALLTATDERPPHQREVFVAHEVEGLSSKQIATPSSGPTQSVP